MDQAWRYDLPFDPLWSSEQFSVAVQYLIKKVLQYIYSRPNAFDDLIRGLLESRFIPLYHNSSAVDLLKGINTINDPHLVIFSLSFFLLRTLFCKLFWRDNVNTCPFL